MPSPEIPGSVGRRRLLKAGGLLAGALTVPVGSVAARPTELAECTEIDEPGDYVLTNDLEAAGDCLTVTADAVTLDGAGHTIAGNGNGYGVRSDAAETTVLDVTVTGFDTGIGVAWNGISPDHAVLADVAVRNNHAGIVARRGSDLTIRDATIEDNAGDAISYRLWTGIRITGSTIRENDGAATSQDEGWELHLEDSMVEGNGRGVHGAPGDVIANNTISANDGYGIAVDPFPMPPFSDHATIDGNVIQDNGGPGIELFLGHGDIRANTVAANGGGISLERVHDEGEEWIPTATLRANNISDHPTYGLQNLTDDVVDARCNWWGDETGPDHPDNPEADPGGDAIEGDAEFIPWSVAPIESGEVDGCDGGVAFFAVTMSSLPAEVVAGEEAVVGYAVTNVGGLGGTQAVVFSLDGREEAVEDSVSLDPDETYKSSFAYPTGPGDVGQLAVSISTADDADRAELTVVDSDAPDHAEDEEADEESADSSMEPSEDQSGDERDTESGDDSTTADSESDVGTDTADRATDDPETDAGANPDDGTTNDPSGDDNGAGGTTNGSPGGSTEASHEASEHSGATDGPTADGTPGFGIGSAIAGLGGLGYFLKRRIVDE